MGFLHSSRNTFQCGNEAKPYLARMWSYWNCLSSSSIKRTCSPFFFSNCTTNIKLWRILFMFYCNLSLFRTSYLIIMAIHLSTQMKCNLFTKPQTFRKILVLKPYLNNVTNTILESKLVLLSIGNCNFKMCSFFHDLYKQVILIVLK